MCQIQIRGISIHKINKHAVHKINIQKDKDKTHTRQNNRKKQTKAQTQKQKEESDSVKSILSNKENEMNIK